MKMSRFGLRSSSEGFKLLEEHTMRTKKKGINIINNNTSAASHISHCPRITAAIDTGLTLSSTNTSTEIGGIAASKLRTSHQKYITPKKFKKKKNFLKLQSVTAAEIELFQQQNNEMCNKEGYDMEQHKSCKSPATISTQENQITRTVSLVCSLPLERLPRIVEKLSILKNQNQKQQKNSCERTEQKQQEQEEHEKFDMFNDPEAEVDHALLEKQLKGQKPTATVNILCLYCEKKFTSIKLQIKHVEKTHMKRKDSRRRCSGRNVQQKQKDNAAQCHQFIGCIYCSSESEEGGKIKLKQHIVKPMSSSSTTTSFSTATQICVPAKDLTPLFIHLTEYHADKYFGCRSCTLRFQSSAKLAKHMQHMHHLEQNQHHKITFPLMTTRKRERELKRNNELFKETDNDVLFNDDDVNDDNDKKEDVGELVNEEQKVEMARNLKQLQRREKLKKKSPIESTKIKASLDRKKKDNVVVSGSHNNRNAKLKRQKMLITTSTASETKKEEITKEQEKAKSADTVIVFSSSSKLLVANDDDEQMLSRLGLTQNQLHNNRNRGTRLRREASNNCVISDITVLSKPKMTISTSIRTHELEVQPQKKQQHGLQESNILACNIVSPLSKQQNLSNNNRNCRKFIQSQEPQHIEDIITATTSATFKLFRVPSTTNNASTLTTISSSLLAPSSSTSSLSVIQAPSVAALSCVFDDNFYKEVVINVRNNLLNHLDGKVSITTTNESRFSTAPTPVLTTSLLQAKFKYQPTQYRHQQKLLPPQLVVDSLTNVSHYADTELHEATSLTSATAFPTLLTAEQYGPAVVDTIVPSPFAKTRRPHSKHSWKWKWDNVKKFKFFNEGGSIVKKIQQPQFGLRDLAKLDMWTQLTMRQKYELNRHLLYQLSPQSPPAFEQCQTHEESMALATDLLAEERARLEKQRLVEQLNYILDLRLLPHIILEQNEQAVIKFESDEFCELSAQKRDEYDSGMSDLMTQTFSDNSFLSILQLQPRFNNSDGAQQATSKPQSNLVLSGEWARPRCYLCICCGAKFEKLKSLEEHKTFRHSHIYATHYEVVGRELLASNLLKHLFIPKCALSRYDAMNNRSSTAYWGQQHTQYQHHRYRQHHHHRQYHYHRKHHHTKHERSTTVEDESTDSVQSICTLQTTYGNISCGDDISMSNKHLGTSLLSSSSSSRPSSASSSTPLNTSAIPMDDCDTTLNTDTKTSLDLNNESPTHSSSSCNASQSSSTSSSSCTSRSRIKRVTIKNEPQTARRRNSNSNSSGTTMSTSFTIATNSSSNVLTDHTGSTALLNAMPTPGIVSCTKCGRKSNGVLDLYRHMLDCSGDYLWSMAKKRKYRYYCGSKKRRPCNKHIAMKRNIKRSSNSEMARPLCDAQMTPNDTEESGSNCSKTKTPPRQRPSDAESIRKMLENLPAKRVCKKIFPTDNKKNKKSKVMKNKLVVVSRTRGKMYSQHVLRKTHQRKISPTRRLSRVKNTSLRQQHQIEKQREQQQQRKQSKQMIKAGRIAVNKKVTSISQANGSGTSTSPKAEHSFISNLRENSSVALTAISINKSSNNDIIITRSSSASKDVKVLEMITSNTATILNRKTSKSRSRSPKIQHSVNERVLHNSLNKVDGCSITARMQRRSATVTNPKNIMDNIPGSYLGISKVGRANISGCSTSSVIEATVLPNKNLLPTRPSTPAIITKAFSQGNLNTLVQSSNFNSTTSTKLNTNIKRSKRISDCIAMLTGKLEEKLKTENPIVSKGSSIKISNTIMNTVNQNPSQNTESKVKEGNEAYQSGNTNKTKAEKSTNMVDSCKITNSSYSIETKDKKEQCQKPTPSLTVCTPPSSSPKIPKRKTVSRRIIKADEVLLPPEEGQVMSVASNEIFSIPPPSILVVDPAETILPTSQRQVSHQQVKSRRPSTTTKSTSKPIITTTSQLTPAVIETTTGKSRNAVQQFQERLLTMIPKTLGPIATINSTFGSNNNACVAGKSITTLKNISISAVNNKFPSQAMTSPISQVTATAAVRMNVLPNQPLYLPMDNSMHAGTGAAKTDQLPISMAEHSIATPPILYKEGEGTIATINSNVTKNIESTVTGVGSKLPLQLVMVAPTTLLSSLTESQKQQQVLKSQFASSSTNLIRTQQLAHVPSAVPLQPQLQSNTLPGLHSSTTQTVSSTSGLQHTKQLIALLPPPLISGNGVSSDIHHLSQFGMEPLNLTSTKSCVKKLGLGQQKEINDSYRVGIPARRQTICGFEARNLIMYDEMEPLDLSKKSTRNKHPSSTDIRVNYKPLTSTAVSEAAAGRSSVGSILNEGQQTNLGSTTNQLPPPQDMPLPLVRLESTLNNLHTELSPLPTQKVTATHSAAAPTSVTLQQQLKSVMPLVVFTPGSLAELPISTTELFLNKHFYSNLDLLKIPQVRNPIVAAFVPTIATGPSLIAPTASLPQSSTTTSTKVNNHETSIIITSPAIQPLTQPSGASSTFSIPPIVACTKTPTKKRSGGSSSGNIKNMEFNNIKSDSTLSFPLTSAYRKESNNTKHQVKSCPKLMDEVINNHIDDAINSVIMAVQESLPDDDKDNYIDGKVNIKTKGTERTKQEQQTKPLAMTAQHISAAGQVQQVEYASVGPNQSLRHATLVTTPTFISTPISTVEVLPVPPPSLRLQPSIDTNVPTPTSIIYSEAVVEETMRQQNAGKSQVLVPQILSIQKPQTEQQPIRHLTPKKRARAKTIDCRSALLIGETSHFATLDLTTASNIPVTQQQEQQTHDEEMQSSVTRSPPSVSPISKMSIPPNELTYLKSKTTDCKYLDPLKKDTTLVEKARIEESNSKEVNDMIRDAPLIIEVKTIQVGKTIGNPNKDSLIMDTKCKSKAETSIPQTKMEEIGASTTSQQFCKEPGNTINSYSLVSEEHTDIMKTSPINIEQQQQTKDSKTTSDDLEYLETTTKEVANSEFIKSGGDHTTNTLASDVVVVKKQRRRRKNELAAIVADQLLESFKIDNVRRDNLKKLENLAYEKSEDLLLTGILLMSSTKRNAAEKQQQTTESPYKRTKIDNTVTYPTTRKQHCTNKLRINGVGGGDEDNIPSLLELKATRGRPKRRQLTYQKRGGCGNRTKSKPMASENFIKLKSTLESFSIGIEKQLSEIEAKNSRMNTSSANNNELLKSSPSVGRGRARKNNLKAETVAGSTTTPLPSSSILRPSILNSAAQDVQIQTSTSKIEKQSSSSIDRVSEPYVKHKSVPKNGNDEVVLMKGGALDDQNKNTIADVATVPQSVSCAPANNVTIAVYSRDPRLNKNIHKKENNNVTQSQQGGTKLHDRRLRLNEICDLEEDNYLTEIAKNVNEKIMSGGNEDFGFANDEFELNNEPDNDNDDDGEDEHDKYYRPATSMSVRSAPNLNDDHSNFDSICGDNTNTEVMDMDLDDEISVYTSYSQDVGRGCRRRRRRRSILLTRRPKKRATSTRDLSAMTFDCVLCKKTFFTGTSLGKHNMTLAHVSKVSEQEYLMSKTNGAGANSSGEEKSFIPITSPKSQQLSKIMEDKKVLAFNKHLVPKERSLPLSTTPPPAPLTDATEGRTVPPPIGCKMNCCVSASSINEPGTLSNSKHDVERLEFSPLSPDSTETVVFTTRSMNTLLITEETLRMHDHHQQNLQLCQQHYNNQQEQTHQQQNHQLQHQNQQHQLGFSSDCQSNNLVSTSRLNMNPDERLFIECANILKGVETSHISQSTLCEDPRLNKVHAYAYANAPPSVSRPPSILLKKSVPPTQAPLLPAAAPAPMTSIAMNVELESPQSPSPESTTTKELSPARQYYLHPQNQQNTPPQQSPPRSPSPTPKDLNLQEQSQHLHHCNPQAMHHHTGHLLTYNNKLPLPISVAASSPLPICTQNTHADPTINLTSLHLSPNYSAISQFSATNMTTSRFKTKAAMKGYENVDLTLQREIATKSRAICKLTELANIALGSEKRNSQEFLSIQTPQLSLSTPTSESDSNSKNEYQQDQHHRHHDNEHYLTQQRHYLTQNQLNPISEAANNITALLHQNNRNAATNENQAPTTSKALKKSVAIVVRHEQGRLPGSTTTGSHDITEQNKIVIPDRPFKNIGLEEKETIQFQKPKIISLSLLTTEDDNNSVSTASYSDRDDYDFGTMSCCDEIDDNENENEYSEKLDAIKQHEVKQNTDLSSTAPTSSATSATSSSSESSSDTGGRSSNTSSSHVMTKTFENKSLIMGRIFKSASSKVKTNEVGTVTVVASPLTTLTHKVKNLASAVGGGLQQEQYAMVATTALPPPKSKANLDQLFDELRGASGRVKSNETIVSSDIFRPSRAATGNEKYPRVALIQPALVSVPTDILPPLSTKDNHLILKHHPKTIATTCSKIQTPAARKVSVPAARSKPRTTKAKKTITSSINATATNTKKLPEKLIEKGVTRTTTKNIRTPRSRGRKDITKLQTELGMSQEEIEKLIDEGQRKSKRRCATNRTKKLVETWSSDEYEEFLSTKDIIALIEEKEQQEKRRKGKKSSTNVSSQNASKIQQEQSVVLQKNNMSSGTGSVSLSIQFGGENRATLGALSNASESKECKGNQKAQLKKVNATKARAKSRLETSILSIPDTGDDKNNKKERKKRVSARGGDKPKQQQRNNIGKVKRTAANIGLTLNQSAPLTKAPRITSRLLSKVGGGNNKKINVTNSNFVGCGTGSLTPAAQSIWTATKVMTKQYDAALSPSSSTELNKRYIIHGNKASKTENSASSTIRTAKKHHQRQRYDHHEVVSGSKLSQRNNNANKNIINVNTVVSSRTASRAGADVNVTTKSSINNNNSSKNNKNLKTKHKSQTNHNQSSASRRKRPATEKQLYYWSSSSSSSIAASSSSDDVRQHNEYLSLNENHQYSAITDGVTTEQPQQQEKCHKQDQEHFDETTEQYQKHGWIVGDSHKKLVKLLAIAKSGNTKVDNRSSVKRQTLKRKCL